MASKTTDISLELGDQLGKGSYGAVYDARKAGFRIRNYEEFAHMAPYCAVKTSKRNSDELVHEYKILKMLDLCPNVVRVFGIGDNRKYGKVMVMERLYDTLRDRAKMTLVEKNGVFIPYLKGLFSALVFLAKHNIVHTDLHWGNIMFEKNRHDPILIDFGLAQEIDLERNKLVKFPFHRDTTTWRRWHPPEQRVRSETASESKSPSLDSEKMGEFQYLPMDSSGEYTFKKSDGTYLFITRNPLRMQLKIPERGREHVFHDDWLWEEDIYPYSYVAGGFLIRTFVASWSIKVQYESLHLNDVPADLETLLLEEISTVNNHQPPRAEDDGFVYKSINCTAKYDVYSVAVEMIRFLYLSDPTLSFDDLMRMCILRTNDPKIKTFQQIENAPGVEYPTNETLLEVIRLEDSGISGQHMHSGFGYDESGKRNLVLCMPFGYDASGQPRRVASGFSLGKTLKMCLMFEDLRYTAQKALQMIHFAYPKGLPARPRAASQGMGGSPIRMVPRVAREPYVARERSKRKAATTRGRTSAKGLPKKKPRNLIDLRF